MFSIHSEVRQLSARLIRKPSFDNDIQMELRCSQLFIDCQQQCIFVIQVNIQLENSFQLILYFR
jgi:hypothetical protein